MTSQHTSSYLIQVKKSLLQGQAVKEYFRHFDSTQSRRRQDKPDLEYVRCLVQDIKNLDIRPTRKYGSYALVFPFAYCSPSLAWTGRDLTSPHVISIKGTGPVLCLRSSLVRPPMISVGADVMIQANTAICVPFSVASTTHSCKYGCRQE